jgi:hypothetical protein
MICGNEKTPNLLVGQKSACRLDFLPAKTGKAEQDWLDAAKLVRERMPKIHSHYYDNRLLYAIHCDEPTWEKPKATFEQAEKLIRDFAILTDYCPQVAHLWGWQYRGKDTGYPAVAEVNQRIGGYDGLMRLLEAGPKYKCTVTFSDNYDDGYKSSPAWDPDIVARRPDGELWISRNWTGEVSFVLGLANYVAKGSALERVRFTCEHYQLRETTHVDVLSYFPIRNDWNRAHPASGFKNFEARSKIVDEFAKYGVDLSSEALRYPFIGKISAVGYMPTPHPCPFGGKPIPLLPLIYRKSADWGRDGGHTGGMAEAMLHMLFYNTRDYLWRRDETDAREITDRFYVYMLPWFKLHDRNIETFRREGDRTMIGLEGNSMVDLDWGKERYSVTLDGSEIARDLNTTCPLDAGRVAFYSIPGQELSYPMPAGWEPSGAVAIALSLDKSEEVPVKLDGGRITVSTPPRRPVIVYRDAEEGRRRLQQGTT